MVWHGDPNSRQGPTAMPWWEQVNDDPPTLAKNIKHPNVKLLAAHKWDINDAIALGEDDLWVCVKAGDINTALVRRAKVRHVD